MPHLYIKYINQNHDLNIVCTVLATRVNSALGKLPLVPPTPQPKPLFQPPNLRFLKLFPDLRYEIHFHVNRGLQNWIWHLIPTSVSNDGIVIAESKSFTSMKGWDSNRTSPALISDFCEVLNPTSTTSFCCCHLILYISLRFFACSSSFANAMSKWLCIRSREIMVVKTNTTVVRDFPN